MIEPRQKMSQRDRPDWPKMTCVMSSLARKLDQRVGHARALELHHARAQVLGETDVLRQRGMILAA